MSKHNFDDPAVALDRRKFLSGVSLAAGAVLTSAMLPVSLQAAEAAVTGALSDDGLWSIDVMCGHWPPYSHPIPYGRPAVEATFAHVAPEDLMFVV